MIKKISVLILSLLWFSDAFAESLILQSTTSTHNSGLTRAILPQFTVETGISVRVVAVGTGQALRNAQNCDGDVLLVHSKAAEEAFVANGYGDYRRDVMYNDFIIIGPKNDPAGLIGLQNIEDALRAIKASEYLFISRGDDSGTHEAEKRLWKLIDIDTESLPFSWYKEVGNGMGATLNITVEKRGYTLTDRATWLAFNNKFDSVIVFEGDKHLHNQYGIIPVSKSHCPRVNSEAASRFIDWILSPVGQAAIGAYRPDGEQLFFPNAQ